MSRSALFIARFCSSAWIGAAVLFVVVGIREITLGDFDATIGDRLVALRFPAFYFTGVTLVALSWLGAFWAGQETELTQRRRLIALGALLAVSIVMALDYFWIYVPLSGMMVPPGQRKPVSFTRFHEAAKYVNLLGLTLCFAASVALNWPNSKT